MTMFWKLVHDGRTPPLGEVVRPDERLSTRARSGSGRATPAHLRDAERTPADAQPTAPGTT